MLYAHDGVDVSTKLHFFFTTNEAKYEALTIRLISANKWEYKIMCPWRFLAIIKQVNEEITLMEIALASIV